MSINIQVKILTWLTCIPILKQQEVNRLRPGDLKHCVYEFLPHIKHNSKQLQKENRLISFRKMTVFHCDYHVKYAACSQSSVFVKN
jgi:hypothetical protein